MSLQKINKKLVIPSNHAWAGCASTLKDVHILVKIDRTNCLKRCFFFYKSNTRFNFSPEKVIFRYICVDRN